MPNLLKINDKDTEDLINNLLEESRKEVEALEELSGDAYWIAVDRLEEENTDFIVQEITDSLFEEVKEKFNVFEKVHDFIRDN